jgi:hypothetical protein
VALGSVVVLLASLTFVAASQSARAVTQTPPTVASGTTAVARGASASGGAQGTSTPTSVSNGLAHDIALGDYAGEANPFGVATFGLQTGTIPTYATDYLNQSAGWDVMDSAINVTAWSPTHYHLVLGVPILPGVGTLAQGATGAYDRYFTTLGQNLVKDREAGAILRLGWEFNTTAYPWSVADPADAANYVAYWRQIVTTMRSVPGQKFKFLWNPGGQSTTTYTPDEAYPGDPYVDYVGTDVFDTFGGKPFAPAAAWTHDLTEQWGLDWLAAFAVEHNKPVAIPEWSDAFRIDGHGLGDDPSFIDNMAGWFVSNNVAFADVWSADITYTYRDNLLDGAFPRALARFKADFG